jgi:predicted ATPase
MVLTAFRPRRDEASWRLHETAERDYHHRYSAIHLNALGETEARELVWNLLYVEDLPESVRKKILDKSEGNPFFIEELIRSLLDEGLVVNSNGRWVATKEIEQIKIPNTLMGVITSRLDRLSEPVKQVAQAASVLGREFSPDVLSGIVDAPDQIGPALVELQRRELLREKIVTPQRIFSFKHILTQESAYNSMLLSSRRELHRRAADWLIVRSPE